MTYVLALLAGIVGAIAGYAASGSLAAVIANTMGMSNFEGAVGYFAFLGIGPIGGLIGLIAGIWLVLRRRGFRAGALAGRGVLVIVGIGALAVGVVAVMYFQRDLVTTNSLPPQLMFEVRLPPGAAAPSNQSDITIELDTDKNRMPAFLAKNWIRTEDGRAIIAGGVDLYYRTSQRMLVLRLPNQPTRLFTLKLRASPAASDDFGGWQRVDFIDDSTSSSQPRRADATDGYEIRYRVEDRSRMRMVGIDFEIRLPEGTALPQESSGIRVALRTDDQEYEGKFLAYDWRRQDGARTVLIGGMGIPDPRAHPRVLLALPGAPVRVFAVTFPTSTKLGAWQPAEMVEEPGQQPRPARPDEAFEFRYAESR
jgi:hypothetical protein